MSIINFLDIKSQVPDLFILDGEFVVVGDFLPNGDGLFRVNDDLTGTVNLDHFGVTVGLVIKCMNDLVDCLHIFTSQEWFMNRARLPHLVASTTPSKSIRNK